MARTGNSLEETTRDVRRNFDNRKTYPGGNGHYWEDFLKSQKGKAGLFMLVVERELSLHELSFGPHRENLFGLYADRTDGKLGRNCFGWATPDFDEAKRPYERIFTVDGYDPEFLHTRDYSPDALHLPAKRYKIVEVIDSEDEVVSEIAKLARRFISADVPTDKQAKVLSRICSILGRVLHERPHPVIKDIRKEVALKVRERWSFLKDENEKLSIEIRTNEAEMTHLVLESL